MSNAKLIEELRNLETQHEESLRKIREMLEELEADERDLPCS